MNRQDIVLELDRRGLLAEVAHMVERAEWDWDDAVIEVLVRHSRQMDPDRAMRATAKLAELQIAVDNLRKYVRDEFDPPR